MDWSAKYSRPQCIAADQVPGLVNTAIQRQASISSQRLCGSKIIEEDVSTLQLSIKDCHIRAGTPYIHGVHSLIGRRAEMRWHV